MLTRIRHVLGLKAPARAPQHLDWEGLKLVLQRKPIRTLRLAVHPQSGQVRVSAPLGLGENVIRRFVQQKKDWILRQQLLASAQEPATAGDDERHRQTLQALLPAMIAIWELRLGVRVIQWRCRRMRTRWGSCNIRARRVTFNLELGRKDAACLEYIVVHELLHLLEPTHGPRFKALLNQHYPLWRDCRSRLNARGPASPVSPGIS